MMAAAISSPEESIRLRSEFLLITVSVRKYRSSLAGKNLKKPVGYVVTLITGI
jgi:hypothetical protein